MKIRLLFFGVLAVLVLAAPVTRAVQGDQVTFNKGVEAYDSGHYEEAYKIFLELAEKDDLAAMRNVALMLRHGKGVEKDPDEALDWYERAAEAGLVTAQADLGVMLLDGEAGKPDPKAAMPWLMQAAEAGHPMAQFRLGEMYEKGTPFMAPDVNAAKKLYGAAAAHRQRGAAARLAALMGLTEPSPTTHAKAAPAPAPATEQADVTTAEKAPAAETSPPPQLRATPDPAAISRQPEPATQYADPKGPGAATKHKTFAGPQLKPSR